MKKRILSFDPGTTNTGVAVTEIDTDTGKSKVLMNTMLGSPIKNLAHNLYPQVKAFTAEVDGLVKTWKPNGLIAERFQARGLLGASAECISVMLGIMIERYDIPIKFVTAATWKNAFNRRIKGSKAGDLKNLYKICMTVPHQLDAVLLGLYALEVGTKIIPQYSLTSLILQVEKTSQTKLIRRKTR